MAAEDKIEGTRIAMHKFAVAVVGGLPMAAAETGKSFRWSL